jgi:(p)ppGpp synthase/HD superfamily hydrolase
MNLDPLRWHKFYATVKHGDQKYGFLPYTTHLAAVENVLRRFNITDSILLGGAWLHDVCEDTGTKVKEIEELFGEETALIIGAVTNERGESRKVRAALTYPKIRSNKKAVILKLADRIANVENGGSLVTMYRKEYEDFKRALYTKDENEEMWSCLDRLLL